MQQKLFRVERMHTGSHAGVHEHRHVVDELKALRALAERRDSGASDAVQSLKRELDELRASVDGMDHATQKILSSVELIDDGARSLASSLKNDYERGLAQDMQDHVVKIYEACNFQDLAGQRISNVIGIMTMLEDQVAAMIERCNTVTGVSSSSANTDTFARALLNGPKLDGDDGHASQCDIDKMFD